MQAKDSTALLNYSHGPVGPFILSGIRKLDGPKSHGYTLRGEENLPAFHEPQREIVRPCFYPTGNNLDREKFAVLDLRLGHLERPIVFPSVKPDEFLTCFFGGGELGHPR